MKCQIKGTLLEISVDVLHVIRQIYRQITENGDPTAGRLFKESIISAVTDKALNLFTTEPPGEMEIGIKASAPEEAAPS